MISSWGRVLSVQFHTAETNIEKKVMTGMTLTGWCRCWPVDDVGQQVVVPEPVLGVHLLVVHRQGPVQDAALLQGIHNNIHLFILCFYWFLLWSTSLLFSQRFYVVLSLVYLICENNLTLPLFVSNTFILFLSINFMEILQWKCAALVGGRNAIDFGFYRKLFPGSWISVDCLLAALILSAFNVSLTNI